MALRVHFHPAIRMRLTWLLLFPALAAAQSADVPPARHDTIEVHDTAPGVAEQSSPQTVKPSEVRELPSRPATVNE